MKNYTVTYPFAGAITITVEAENKEGAKEAFHQKVENLTFDTKELLKINADVEFDYYDKMASGNMRHYQHSEISIEEEEDF